MITTIIGIVLILCVQNSSCAEKRRSFEVLPKRTTSPKSFRPWESQSRPDLPPPSVAPPPPPVPFTTKIAFDFNMHWQKKHTRSVARADGTVEYIIEQEKPMPTRPDHSYGTLHEAAIADDVKGIKQLLNSEEYREFIDGYDMEGQTPLQAAVDYSSTNAIEYLVKEGAHAEISNREGDYSAWTLAQEYAEFGGYTNVVPLMAFSQALSEMGKLQNFEPKNKKKKTYKEKKPSFARPLSYKVKLRRQAPKSPSPQREDGEYDSYLLNV